MPKMPKIQKRCGFNGLADIGWPADNWPKMPKFTSEATAVHHPRQSREAIARRRRKRHPTVKTTVTSD
jgi:transposase